MLSVTIVIYKRRLPRKCQETTPGLQKPWSYIYYGN